MDAASPVDTDLELLAMRNISSALSDLDETQRARVLRWAGDRFLVNLKIKSPGTTEPVHGEDDQFPDVATLYDAANPATQSERALVAAYWLQEIDGQADVDAQQANSELKQLGHGIDNITSAFTDLINQAPRLVIQTRKSGSTRQARKKYRVTHEGIRRVKSMVGKPNGEAR